MTRAAWLKKHIACVRRGLVYDVKEDDGERLSCLQCGESFNVRESGSEDYCPRHATK